MPDVYMFLDEELSKFTDNGIYDKELRERCLKLNEILNNVKDKNYDAHLVKKANAVHKEMEIVNALIHDDLFLDLSKFTGLLKRFQHERQIMERDHYYHSIQCFLLALALIKKIHPASALPKDIAAILYSLTMYHDIGYLYKSINISEEKINDSFADFFLSAPLLFEDDVIRTLCLATESYVPIGLTTNIIETIRRDNSIAGIWKSRSPTGRVLLENDTGLPFFSGNYKNSHAYYSALILQKLFFTKSIIKTYYGGILAVDKDNEKNDWFKQVIKAISLHSRESLSPQLDIATDFYSAYLMIIDELQTYGRLLAVNKYHALINPKYVGFHWDDANPQKLVIDIMTTNKSLRAEYNAHSYQEISSKLTKKIDLRSLATIFS